MPFVQTGVGVVVGVGVVEIVVVEVEEETKIKTKVNPTLTPPLVPIRRSPSIRVRSIQIFQPETGVGARCTSDTDEELSFVQSLLPAHGRMFLLQNRQIIEVPANSATLINPFTTRCIITTKLQKYIAYVQMRLKS